MTAFCKMEKTLNVMFVQTKEKTRIFCVSNVSIHLTFIYTFRDIKNLFSVFFLSAHYFLFLYFEKKGNITLKWLIATFKVKKVPDYLKTSEKKQVFKNVLK